MGIEHATLGTVVGRSNHSPMKDLQLAFSKVIHKLHFAVRVLFNSLFYKIKSIIKLNIVT